MWVCGCEIGAGGMGGLVCGLLQCDSALAEDGGLAGCFLLTLLDTVILWLDSDSPVESDAE